MSFLASLTDEPALSFEYDATADRWTCSPDLRELYGIPAGEDPTTTTMLERVVDEDRQVVLQRFEEVLATAHPFSLEYRLIAPDGRTRRLVLVGQSEDAGGEVKRVAGFIIDITQTIRDGAAAAVLASTEHRAAIEQAKGALMLSFGIGQDAAFEMLRTYSNQHNTKLVRVAEYIIAGLADPAFAREEPVRSLLDILLSLEAAAVEEASDTA
jgi:PAS domain S-box-containing protein